MPSKIIAVGLNYADHARETGKPLPKEPLIWFKATTSLLPDGGKIEIPFPHHRTDYEAELAIVIGRKIRNVAPAHGVALHFRLHRRAGHQRPHDSERREPMGALQIVRHLHAAGPVRGNED